MAELLSALKHVVTSPPLGPFFWLLAGYLVVWGIAYLVARLQLGTLKSLSSVVEASDSRPIARIHADEAADKAWTAALFLHVSGAVLVFGWLIYDYLTVNDWLGVGEWPYLILY